MYWERGRKEKEGAYRQLYISHELGFGVSMVYFEEDKTGHRVRGSFHIRVIPKQVPDPGRGRSDQTFVTSV